MKDNAHNVVLCNTCYPDVVEQEGSINCVVCPANQDADDDTSYEDESVN